MWVSKSIILNMLILFRGLDFNKLIDSQCHTGCLDPEKNLMFNSFYVLFGWKTGTGFLQDSENIDQGDFKEIKYFSRKSHY